LQATKAGDINYHPATTARVTVALQPASQSTLTLNAGSPLTYNATETLSTTGGSGTGEVSYQVKSGSCSISRGDQLKANSGTDSCTVEATKASDDNYNATSASTTVTLQRAATQTTLGASVAFSIPVPTVTLTATISSPAGTPSSGTVAFDAGGSDIPGCASVSVSAGKAICTTNSLVPSLYEVTAVYSGNEDYLGSTAETRISTLLGKMARNSWYLSPEGWIVRAYTNAEAPNEVYIEVMDRSGNIVNAPDISGMGSNPMLIAADAVAPEVSLGFDKVSRTAYVIYTSAGGKQVVPVSGIRVVP
jgi:trimeric autotransporter adhesin